MDEVHTDVHARLIVDGELARLFQCNNNGQIHGLRGTAAAPFPVKFIIIFKDSQ